MDCPNIENCPFPDMKCDVSDELWKVLYCFEDAVYGFDSCARYIHKNRFNEKPPADLLPNN